MHKLLVSICLVFSIACDRVQGIDNINSSEQSKGHVILGEKAAKIRLQETLEGKGPGMTFDTLIKSRSTAIALVEPLLFDVYGQQQIVAERPYEVYLIDGYWYLSGTTPNGSDGGGFEVIIRARDAEVIRFTHYK